MKRTKLFKSLLVAAGLCVGASAWGVETWDFTNSETWKSIALPTADNNSVSYNASGETTTTGNYVTFYSTEGKIVHASTATNGIGFSATGSTSDNYVKLTVPAGSAASVTAYVSSNRNVNVQFGSKTDTYSGNWAEVTKDYDNTSGTEDVDLIIYCSANAGGSNQAPYLRKITLQQAVAVTLNYKDEEGNTLANSVTEFIETGTSYTPTYTSPLYVSDTDPYTYTYKSGAETKTITAATTFDIIYSKAERPSYKIITIKSYGEKNVSSEATVYEGAAYTYYYPRFILDGNTLYKYSSSTDANASSSYWKSTLTNVSANASYTLTYTAMDGECVYYAEGENIDGTSAYTNATFVARSSNGGIGVLTAATLTTLDAGSYAITARIIGRADRSMDFFTGSTEGTNILNAGSNTTGKETTSDIFTLAESTAIVGNGGYVTSSENGHGLDYVYIMKCQDFTATYYNDASWENVYAYTFGPETLGAWPGTQITATDGVYNVSFKAVAAPTNIIFNHGNDQAKTADLPFEDGAAYNSQGKLNSYTATFTTNLGWEPVCAYAWSGDGDSATKFLGAWPGKTITATEGKFTLTFLANNAPEKIIFNNGKQPDEEGASQTSDFAFVDSQEYAWNNYTFTATFTTNLDWANVNAYAWTKGNPDVLFLGQWPGTKLEAVDGIYTATINVAAAEAPEAPEYIIFNNIYENQPAGDAQQTKDLTFEDGKAYTWNAYTVTFVKPNDWTGASAWVWNGTGESTVNLCKNGWPGDPMSDAGDNKYTYTYKGVAAPEMILFDDGKENTSTKTDDFEFEDGAVYSYDGITTVTKTISAAGYATYCSTKALDFTNTGLTAYIAKTGEDNKISFSVVTKVPAKTGVLLKGAAGTYTINTTSAETDNVDDNVLQGVTVDTPIEKDNFVLMNGTAGVGFYKTTQTFTVGANTAYIPATDGARTFIGLDLDNTSADAQGIDGVATVKANSGEIFNLQGQRVSTAKKGLYIVNGKKVVMK